MEDLIKQYGGVVQKSVSKKVDYMVAGTGAGYAKMEKAEKDNVKIIGTGFFVCVSLSLFLLTPKCVYVVCVYDFNVCVSFSYSTHG